MRVLQSLLVVGGGNMGASLLGGCLAGGLVPAGAVTVIEPVDERARDLSTTLGVKVVEQATAIKDSFQVVLLAVKPQLAEVVAQGLQHLLRSDALVLSCMAGVTLSRLRQYCPSTDQLVRFMPNLPAQIGQSMSVYMATPGLSSKNVDVVERILGASGRFLRVEQEDLINAATAISGSGTGYVAYFMEHMVEAGQLLGFSREQSSELVAQTFRGAVSLWEALGVTPEQLRISVTSPGGTTAAALEVFERLGVGQGIQAGMQAAKQRAEEL